MAVRLRRGLQFVLTVPALLIGCGCAKAAGTPGGAASSVPPVQPVGEQGPASRFIPDLGAAPAPDWVKLGLRLTYHIETATIAGIGAEWKEDENGIWKSEDGRRWTPSSRRPGAAEGYLQVDVTAMPNGAVVAYASFYLVPSLGAAPKLSFSYPVIGPAANAGGFWVSPAKLKSIATIDKGDLKVLRMPYKIGDKSRPAVWLQASSDKGYMMYVYDEATGVLLHDGSSVQGKSSPVIGKDEPANTPSQILSAGTLVSQRVIAYPWSGQDAKPWSGSAGPLVYTGTTTVPTAGGRSFDLGQELTATPQGSGPGWVRYAMMLKTTNSMGMPPSSTPSETVSGLGQFGSAWLPPATLAGLTKGALLDEDPITLVKVTVTSVSQEQVVISAVSPAQTTRWGYDVHTGLMNLIEKEDHSVYAPIKTRLTLKVQPAQ